MCKKTRGANRVTGEVVFVLRELAFVEYLQRARHGVDTHLTVPRSVVRK